MGPPRPSPYSSSYPRAYDGPSRSSSSHRSDKDAAEDWVKPPPPGASSSHQKDTSASGSWNTTGASSGWNSLAKADGGSTSGWGSSNTTGGWDSLGAGTWGSTDWGKAAATSSAPAWGSTWGSSNNNAMDTEPAPGPSVPSASSRPTSSTQPQESTQSASHVTWGSSSTPVRDAWGSAMGDTSEPMQIDEPPAVSFVDKGKGKEVLRDPPLVDKPSLPHRRSSSIALPVESPDLSRVREVSIVSNRSHTSDKSGSHISSIPTDPQEIHHRSVKQVNSLMHTTPY